MSDTHSKTDFGACCGSCQNANRARPRYVVGVFAKLDGAHDAARSLRLRTAENVDVLTGSALMAHDLLAVTALSLMRCGRLYQQVAHHLETGAAIVVVHAQSAEQQLGMSRVLLDSNCDMLLTHEGAHHAHAD